MSRFSVLKPKDSQRYIMENCQIEKMQIRLALKIA